MTQLWRVLVKVYLMTQHDKLVSLCLMISDMNISIDFPYFSVFDPPSRANFDPRANLKSFVEIDWFDGVLCRFEQYFSHITVTVHFPGLHQYWARALKVSSPRTHPWKTQRIKDGSNPGPLDYPWIWAHQKIPLIWAHLIFLLCGNETIDQ